MTDAVRSARRARLDRLRDAILSRPVVGAARARFSGHWTRGQWVQAGLFAVSGALLGALVPGLSGAVQPAQAEVRQMSMALPLPQLHRIVATAPNGWQVVSVAKGDTLGGLLREFGVPREQRALLLGNAGLKAAQRRMHPGSELGLKLDAASRLLGFRYDRDPATTVELRFDGERLVESVVTAPVQTRLVVLSGEVGESLYASARKVGVPAKAIDTLTDDIFKYDIDFDSDVGENDRFSVLVEQTWREGQLVETGPVLAAAFTVGDQLHTGIRYERNGEPEYFTAEGKPLKKTFIRMPIPYARLSSGFGGRRHPILGRFKMHKGVDYAAGTGTPIMAAGDARVKSIGWHGGYGRAVELDHGEGKSTFYAHMSRFGNIRPGQRIAQGTVIGYVGSTGLSTGPHLHYEFRVNGVHRNPLSITLPPPEPLAGAELADFRVQTQRALSRIREVEEVIYQGDSNVRVAGNSVGTPRRK